MVAAVSPSEVDARVEAPVRGDSILRAFDRVFVKLDGAIDRVIPESLNPLAQTGAIANTTFLIALASGIVLLLWYTASIHEAYSSIQSMGGRSLPGIVRSVHRYSSDACMLLVIIHSLKLFFARRFGGARWLAWVTGGFLVATLWLVGWLGYWLVWDERSRQVALGTARMLDALPVFADPLSRSFLTDDKISSLLFFVVFFFHMLIPLAMGVALWLHITRLSRPHFLTKWRMTLWVCVSIALVSVLLPADLAAPAHMTQAPGAFAMDAWYLAPLGLTDRLGSGALWAITLVSGIAFYSIPWTLARKRASAAVVIESKCNACENCYKDCPYDAITMVPRTDGKVFLTQAFVDPSKCVSCGICAGSCDSAGVGLPWFDVLDKRAEMDRFVAAACKRDSQTFVAFVCTSSAGETLEIDPVTAHCALLPGYTVMRVPCAGWVHALTVERAIRHGAAGVLIVACGPGSSRYREGGKWTEMRMAGERVPSLNLDKVDPAKVRVLELFRGDARRLSREAAAFRSATTRSVTRQKPRRWLVGASIAVALTAMTWAASRVGYALPSGDQPQLVVSFKHPGRVSETCRDLTEEEKNKTPPHMRPSQICDRTRVSVRMRVTVDDHVISERAYAPAGLWGDGNSLAIERVPITPGRHDVRVQIGDGPNASEYGFDSAQTIDFAPRAIKVVRFDKTTGFEWR